MRQPSVHEDLFLPSHRCLTSPSRWTPCDINATYTSLKSTFSGLQFRRYNPGLSSFAWLLFPPKHQKYREIPREFDLTTVQGHPRSSILVSMESPLCDFLLVINCNFSRICYRFRDIHAER